MIAAADTMVLNAGSGCARALRAAELDWDSLDEPLQLLLAGAALRRAAASIAFQAEMLAREIETGSLQDRGGPDALRLLADLARVTAEEGLGCIAPG